MRFALELGCLDFKHTEKNLYAQTKNGRITPNSTHSAPKRLNSVIGLALAMGRLFSIVYSKLPTINSVPQQLKMLK